MPRNNYSIYDDPSAIDPTAPSNPFDNGGGGSTGVGNGGGYTGGTGGNTGNWTSPKDFPRDPYSQVNLNSWWGQLPFYMEKQFLNLVNRDSGLYKDFQQNLMKSLGGQFSTNSLLGMNLAMGGGGFGGSQFLANEKMKQIQGKVADTAVGATDQFYQGMQGQAGSMLNLMLQDRTALYNRDTQKMLAEMNKPDFWSEFGKGLFGLGSSALGGWASNWGR